MVLYLDGKLVATKVSGGGTGVTSFTDHGVVLGSGAGALSVTDAGTSGQVLTSGGASADPAWATAAAGYSDAEAIAAVENEATLVLQTGVVTGTMTLGSGSVVDSSGAISFDDENLSTTGTITAAGFTAAADGVVTLANEGKVKFTDTTFADGDQRSSGITLRFTTDTLAVAIGQAVHLSGTGVILADADVASQGAIPCIGVAASATTGSGTENIDVLVLGCMRYDTYDFTVGSDVFVTATPGGLDETAPSTTGHYVQKVGIAMSADILYVHPSIDVIEHA